jgi:hypothetical protein
LVVPVTKLPAVVEKDTVSPAGEALFDTVIVARIAMLEPAVTELAPAVKLMLLTTGEAADTLIASGLELTAAVTAVKVSVTVLPAATVVEAVYVEVATPLALVVAVTTEKLPVVLEVLKVTCSLGTTLPNLSFTEATTLTIPLGFTEVADALNVTLDGEPATKLTVPVLLKFEMVAVTVVLPTVVGAVRATVAVPLLAVVAEVLVDAIPDTMKLPAWVVNMTVAPGTGLPLGSLTDATRAVVDEPSAMTLGLAMLSLTPPMASALVLTVMVAVPCWPPAICASSVSLPLLAPAT